MQKNNSNKELYPPLPRVLLVGSGAYTGDEGKNPYALSRIYCSSTIQFLFLIILKNVYLDKS